MKVKKEKVLRVRLTVHEFEKLSAFASKKGSSASQVIREYLRRLPNLK